MTLLAVAFVVLMPWVVPMTSRSGLTVDPILFACVFIGVAAVVLLVYTRGRYWVPITMILGSTGLVLWLLRMLVPAESRPFALLMVGTAASLVTVAYSLRIQADTARNS